MCICKSKYLLQYLNTSNTNTISQSNSPLIQQHVLLDVKHPLRPYYFSMHCSDLFHFSYYQLCILNSLTSLMECNKILVARFKKALYAQSQHNSVQVRVTEQYFGDRKCFDLRYPTHHFNRCHLLQSNILLNITGYDMRQYSACDTV